MKRARQRLEESKDQINKIRITLNSKNVQNLEKGTDPWDKHELRIGKRVMDLFSVPIADP